MNYSHFVKKLQLPPGFQPPERLTYEDLLARPLTRADLEDDLNAVNSSHEVIRRTRGGSWPGRELRKEFDFLDLAWHEREFRENESFAYVVYDQQNRYIGCFYLYPVGTRTQLSTELLDKDVDASWWVTEAAYKNGYYEKLYAGIRRWLESSFPFSRVHYSNRQVPS